MSAFAQFLVRLAAVAAAASLSACGGSDSSPIFANLADPAIANQLTAVDAIGVGGADLVSNDPAFTDLALQANLKGSSAQVRFSCTHCNITVSAGGASVGANQYLTIPFATLDSSADAAILVTDNVTGAKTTYTLHARPLDYVRYTVDTSSGPEAGDLYLTPFDPQGFGAAYAYIVGTDGSLKYYYREPRGNYVRDFKKTVLPSGAVRYSFYESSLAGIRVMDDAFNFLANVKALPFPDGNTYAVDDHDHVILDDGHYIVGVYANKTVTNIPSLSGQSLFVGGAGLQEIQNGAAVFSWLSTDHPELYACSTEGNSFAANNGADYAHWDSVIVDNDANWVASFRHLDAVLKINRGDGTIAWILGGPCDQYGLTTTQKFSHQYDARRAPDGRLTLFDDNNADGASRALAFGLDESSKTLLSFAAYAADTHSSTGMGSAQFFADGKVLIGWGAYPEAASDVSEFDAASGAFSFQLTLQPSDYANGYFSYRARKFP